jgi:NAD(P)-dependent dehydrogenase (short-subunit alcohol dehydrogenase family)
LTGRLAEKVAIITGSGRGIGRAIALGFAREGARIVVADVRQALAESTAAEIRGFGTEALPVVVDVTRDADLDDLVHATVEHFGRIDILHNNAGVLGHTELFAYTPAEWDAILAVNVKAAFFASQKVARVMIDQGHGGRILNTASTSAFIASSRPTIPYDVSKAGIRQLTVSLAAHLVQYGINVNAIAPGTIETELTVGRGDAETRAWMERRVKEKIPMQRIGQPEDLVGAAVYLCSEEAAYVTGHTIVVDGGVLLL